MALGTSANQLNYAKKKYYGKFYEHDKFTRWEGEDKVVTISELDPNISFLQRLINSILTRKYQIKFNILNIKRNLFKYISLTLLKKREYKNFDFNINLNNEKIENFSNELKIKGYAFIENFLSDDEHKYLLDTMPSINHFNHLKKVTKHYNAGFLYDYETSLLDKTFNKYPKEYGLKEFYKFLLGEKFKNFYNKLFKTENENCFIATIETTMASKNSYLIPHYDSIVLDDKFKGSFNFIYFIDGYDKNLLDAGATGIYQDNEFKKPLLIPKTMKNSILVYNSKTSNFYHGFKNIDCPFNIYRKTINIHTPVLEKN